MSKSILFYTLSILFFLVSFAYAEKRDNPFCICYQLTKEPVLDGKLDDTVWRNIPTETGFVKLGSKSFTSKQTYFRIGYSSEALYIGVECKDPEVEKIKAKRKDMENVWAEDSVEVFMFPEEADKYYQFAVNAIGSRWSKEPLDWQAKTYKGKDYYSMEIRIPFEVFRRTVPILGEVWRGNICRNILTSGDRNTTWAHLDINFKEPDSFGEIIFATENGIIKIIVTNLESVSEYKKEISKEAKRYPSLKNQINSFLNNYKEIEEVVHKLKGNLREQRGKQAKLLEKSYELLKEVDKLKSKILLESFFN